VTSRQARIEELEQEERRLRAQDPDSAEMRDAGTVERYLG